MTPVSSHSSRAAASDHNDTNIPLNRAFKPEWQTFSQAVVEGVLAPQTPLAADAVQNLADWLAGSPAELRTLNLNGKLPAVGMPVLFEALKVNATLHSLDLSNNPMEDSGAAALSGMLKANRTLRALALRNCSIDTAMVEQLSEALNVNARLETLNLRNNVFGDDALIALSKALAVNTALVNLDINQSIPGEADACYTDSGMAALAGALKRNQTLVAIKLGIAETSEATRAELLSALSDNESLRQLDFFDADFPEQDLRLIATLLANNANLAERAGLRSKARIGLLDMAARQYPDELMDMVLKALIKMPSIPRNDVMTALQSLGDLETSPCADASGEPARGSLPGKLESI